MPRLTRAMRVPLLSIVLLGTPVAAIAAQVDITYNLTSGTCCPQPDLTTKVVIGGTATIRWSLSSLSGSFLNGQPATVLNFTLHTSEGADLLDYFSLSGLPQSVGTQGARVAAGQLPTSPETTIWHTIGTPAQLRATRWAICPAYFCGTTITVPFAQISGQEVSRTLANSPIPVPASGGIGLLALAMLLALAGWIVPTIASRWTRG